MVSPHEGHTSVRVLSGTKCERSLAMFDGV